MFFIFKNKKYLSTEQLRTSVLLKAYYIVQKYPLHASELLLDQYIQLNYGMTLKNICVKLLLKLSFYTDNSNKLILMFKDSKYDRIARLITFGNGAIRGCPILQIALSE